MNGDREYSMDRLDKALRELEREHRRREQARRVYEKRHATHIQTAVKAINAGEWLRVVTRA